MENVVKIESVTPEVVQIKLGYEMLLNAQTYRGEDLKQRGVPFSSVSQERSPRQSLRTCRRISGKTACIAGDPQGTPDDSAEADFTRLH